MVAFATIIKCIAVASSLTSMFKCALSGWRSHHATGQEASSPDGQPSQVKDCLSKLDQGWQLHYGTRCKFQHVGPKATDRAKAASLASAAPGAAAAS